MGDGDRTRESAEGNTSCRPAFEEDEDGESRGGVAGSRRLIAVIC